MLYYSNFLISMFAAIVLIPPLTHAYQKLKIYDMPSERKVHTTPIPRVGGIAIVIASVIPIFIWLEIDIKLLALLVSVLIMFLVGVVDDLKDINYKIKFIVQIIAISLIFLYGFIDTQFAYYASDSTLLNIFILSIYLLFILGVTNAINLSDGLDGLAGGEALLSFSIIALLAYESQNIIVLSIVLAIMGAVFGFLRFNTHPARIFMGDTGSLFLGFLLGLLSVALTYGQDNAYAKTLPLLIVGLPVFDTLMVMAYRISKRQSPFTPDRNHLHHRLLDKGFKHYESVLVIYLIQSVYILSAFFMRYELDQNIVFAFLFISFLVFLLTIQPWQLLLNKDYIVQLKKAMLQNLSKVTNHAGGKIFTLLVVMLIAYCIVSSIVLQRIDKDIAVLLALIFLGSLLFLVYLKNKPCHWIERIAIHILIVMSIYMGYKYGNIDVKYFGQLQIIIITICLLSILVLLLGRRRQQRFIGSPMDYLLIAIALIVPNLPGSPILDPELGYLALKLILLFYCVEFVLFNLEHRWWLVRSTIMLCSGLPIISSFLS